MNIFEIATRKKIKFYFNGTIATEDLWDLKLNDLDMIYRHLCSKQEETSEKSLLKENKKDEILEIQIKIVTHIFEEQMKEAEKREKLKEFKERNQKLMGIIASKQDTELQNKSIDELMTMMKEE